MMVDRDHHWELEALFGKLFTKKKNPNFNLFSWDNKIRTLYNLAKTDCNRLPTTTVHPLPCSCGDYELPFPALL